VDKSRLSVDNWHSLWRTPDRALTTRKGLPPYIGSPPAILQDVDWVRKALFLWITLWMSYPDSLHRQPGGRSREKAQHLGLGVICPPTYMVVWTSSTLSTAPTTITI